MRSDSERRSIFSEIRKNNRVSYLPELLHTKIELNKINPKLNILKVIEVISKPLKQNKQFKIKSFLVKN